MGIFCFYILRILGKFICGLFYRDSRLKNFENKINKIDLDKRGKGDRFKYMSKEFRIF